MATPLVYKQIADALNSVLKPYNYQVAPKKPLGGKPRAGGYTREYRLQLINTQKDTSDQLVKDGVKLIKSIKGDITGVKFNSLSPNSSKFPSIELVTNKEKIDLVIARGANKGENFEKNTVTNLTQFFARKVGGGASETMVDLISQLNEANKDFAKVDIAGVKQRTGSTKKEGVPIEKLGAIIGDIILTDRSNRQWFLSLKDINGYTFSSYSGAATLFDSYGALQPDSPGADFLRAFGTNLNLVQQGFDTRNNITSFGRPKLVTARADKSALKAIFERAWGMNYFYVKRESTGWQVFWIDRKKLDSLVNNIEVYDIRYPSTSSKQISIYCGNNNKKYLVEMRNSKAGEYPNDIKIKITK